MKSLDNLRKLGEKYPNRYIFASQLDAPADEIEAEIAERYMELPLDADGVPIRDGDMVEETDGKYNVLAIATDFWVDIDGYTHQPSECRHAKRTLEDVLREMLKGANGYVGNIIDDYAAEIRGVLGVEQ